MSVSNALKPSPTTPPDSFVIPPLTPPPSEEKFTSLVQHILQEIRGRRDGRNFSSKPWLSFNLTASRYNDLQRVLRTDESLRGFVEDKLRYDYFPSAEQFVLRMPTHFHDVFLFRVVGEISHQLRSIARGESSSAIFAQDVEHCGSASIRFADADYGKHDPDAQFQHLRAQYPGVVIEVSYSQKRRDLARLADDYILGSDGNIRVVVGFKIEYRGKKATLSIWRPQVQISDAGTEVLGAEPTVVDQVICDEDGIPNPDPQAGLRLQLEDFAAEALVENYRDLNDTLFIPAAGLCAYFKSAQDRALTVKQNEGVVTPLTPGARKRRRDSTPPEQLRADCERRFQRDEDQASERAVLTDSSYHASSVSEADSG